MRFMLVTTGTAGDVYPLVGLARGLMDRGHQAHIASHAHHRAFIEATGLPFHEITGVAGAGGHMDFYHRTLSMRVLAEHVLIPAIRPVVALLSALGADWTVISDPHSYGARVAQDLCGFPLITCVVSPFLLRSIERMPVTPGFTPPVWSPLPVKRAFFSLVSHLWDRQLAPGVNAVRRELGLGAVRDVFYGWCFSRDRVIGLFPEWFAPRAADWPPQFVHGGFTVYDEVASAAIPAPLRDARDPLIVFAAGSAGVAAQSFFSAAIDASRGRAWRAVLLAPTYDPPQNLPPNVTHCKYVPLSRLLPISCGIAFHGGLGTMALALAAGTPQIVIPFGHDQYDNAARVERLGVARCIYSTKKLAARLTAAVEEVLSDSVLRNNARVLARQADPQTGLRTTCEEIERTAGSMIKL